MASSQAPRLVAPFGLASRKPMPKGERGGARKPLPSRGLQRLLLAALAVLAAAALLAALLGLLAPGLAETDEGRGPVPAVLDRRNRGLERPREAGLHGEQPGAELLAALAVLAAAALLAALLGLLAPGFRAPPRSPFGIGSTP
jgi:hypothetical protein